MAPTELLHHSSTLPVCCQKGCDGHGHASLTGLWGPALPQEIPAHGGCCCCAQETLTGITNASSNDGIRELNTDVLWHAVQKDSMPTSWPYVSQQLTPAPSPPNIHKISDYAAQSWLPGRPPGTTQTWSQSVHKDAVPLWNPPSPA